VDRRFKGVCFEADKKCRVGVTDKGFISFAAPENQQK
jgi:hypothetical protein